jgi:hypothetical protein
MLTRVMQVFLTNQKAGHLNTKVFYTEIATGRSRKSVVVDVLHLSQSHTICVGARRSGHNGQPLLHEIVNEVWRSA